MLLPFSASHLLPVNPLSNLLPPASIKVFPDPTIHSYFPRIAKKKKKKLFSTIKELLGESPSLISSCVISNNDF
jgi:hypothetical protein